MDRNTLLFIVLSLVVLLTWNLVLGTGPQAPVASGSEAHVVDANSAAPTGGPLGGTAVSSATPDAAPPPPVPATPAVPAWTHTFENALYRAELTNVGAGLTSWKLVEPRYVERTEDGTRPIDLITARPADGVVLGTPLEALGLGNLRDQTYRVESVTSDSAVLVLEVGGVTIRKSFVFDAENYLMRLSIEIDNQSGRVLNPRFETEWPTHVEKRTDFTEQSLVAFHDGGVEREAVAGVGVPGFFSDLFSSADPDGVVRMRGGIEWAGSDTTYFVGALLPDRATSANARFQAIQPGMAAVAVVGFEAMPLPDGQRVQNDFRVYIGPKEPLRLAAVGAQLGQAIDLGYGWIAPLTEFFSWLLHAIYTLVHNYGVAIVLLTILVRVAMLPIVTRQMKSMERMRDLQPQIKELQEKHKDDRQKQSEAMMKLYKESGVNPLGGCFPMLLQFPVFIGLFFALRSSIDLRHAPFFGYIDDLSTPATLFTIPEIDLPIRLLPILMGLSMIVQQRMTPMTMDPAQARMMMTVMPVMMTVLFYQFPSGLVLYWMVSNVLGIAHQSYVGHKLRAAA